MSCSHTYRDLKTFAKLIDDDIIKGESYVTIDKIIKPPEIKSISTKDNFVKMNANAKIAINAIDPNNESLEYQFSPGLVKFKSDPENVFTYKASRNHIREPDGTQTVKIVVVNESNIVSPISEINIICIE
jgi:hypothetical protein